MSKMGLYRSNLGSSSLLGCRLQSTVRSWKEPSKDFLVVALNLPALTFVSPNSACKPEDVHLCSGRQQILENVRPWRILIHHEKEVEEGCVCQPHLKQPSNWDKIGTAFPDFCDVSKYSLQSPWICGHRDTGREREWHRVGIYKRETIPKLQNIIW